MNCSQSSAGIRVWSKCWFRLKCATLVARVSWPAALRAEFGIRKLIRNSIAACLLKQGTGKQNVTNTWNAQFRIMPKSFRGLSETRSETFENLATSKLELIPAAMRKHLLGSGAEFQIHRLNSKIWNPNCSRLSRLLAMWPNNAFGGVRNAPEKLGWKFAYNDRPQNAADFNSFTQSL